MNKNNLGEKFLRIVSQLSDRELFILMNRKVAYKSLEETAKVVNLTRERVRQIEKNAYKKLTIKIKEHLINN